MCARARIGVNHVVFYSKYGLRTAGEMEHACTFSSNMAVFVVCIVFFIVVTMFIPRKFMICD